MLFPDQWLDILFILIMTTTIYFNLTIPDKYFPTRVLSLFPHASYFWDDKLQKIYLLYIDLYIYALKNTLIFKCINIQTSWKADFQKQISNLLPIEKAFIEARASNAPAGWSGPPLGTQHAAGLTEDSREHVWLSVSMWTDVCLWRC